MAVELSRMDFHVTRFMESEEVEEMTASEVGQYCLLLFKAWLLAKDATLPADGVKLAKYARVDFVSVRVLKQFPTVETEWGTRRQNPVQFTIWTEACARSSKGKTLAAKRWQSESHMQDAYAGGNADANAHTIPYQANHTKRNKTSKADQEPLSLTEAFADKVENVDHKAN